MPLASQNTGIENSVLDWNICVCLRPAYFRLNACPSSGYFITVYELPSSSRQLHWRWQIRHFWMWGDITTFTVRILVFRVATLFNFINGYHYFGGKHCLRNQCKMTVIFNEILRIWQVNKQQFIWKCNSFGFVTKGNEGEDRKKGIWMGINTRLIRVWLWGQRKYSVSSLVFSPTLNWIMSCNNIFGIVISVRDRRTEVRSRQGLANFLFYKSYTSSRPALRTTQLPIHWVPGPLLRVKSPGPDAGCSPPSNARVRKSKAVPLLPLCLHGMDSDRFPFYLYL